MYAPQRGVQVARFKRCISQYIEDEICIVCAGLEDLDIRADDLRIRRELG